jgi:hypothetical protein
METSQNEAAVEHESFNDFGGSATDSSVAQQMNYANDGAETQSQPDGIESFDNMTPVQAAPNKSNKVENSKTESKNDKQFLDNQEKDGESEETKVEAKPEEKTEEAKVEAKPEEKTQEVKKPTGKLFKAKDGDGFLDIPASAVLPVKVNGKITDVPVQDLVNNFSGKVMYEQKFQEVSKEKKQIDEQKEYFGQEVEKVKSLVNNVMGLLDKEDGDPTEALYYLLDMTGRNVVQYKQKLFQSNVDKFNEYLNMDEIERNLYWTKEENEFLRKRSESAYRQQTEQRQHHELISKVDKLRETHGVNEEQYVTGLNELYALGYTKQEATPEAVVEYVVIKPHLDAAESLVQPYVDLMDDSAINSLIEDFAYGFRDNKYSVEDAKAMLEKHYGSSQAVKDLNAKAPTRETTVKSTKPSTTELESFDDFTY